jgi:hypothetical protein
MGQPGCVHESVGDVARRYLEVVDEALPGRVEGLYLVGSVALDDFRPGASDVDFLAVTATPLTEDDATTLGEAHERLRDKVPEPALDGVYLTWDHLAADPTSLAGLTSHHDGTMKAEGFDANPVQYLTLAKHPVVLRGPTSPEVFTDDAVLRRWVRANLDTYWAEWVDRQHTLVRGAMLLADSAVGWGVLGTPRLHYTLATGDVTSKTGAGEYALATFDDEWHRIIEEALRLRRGGQQIEVYRRRPLARRRDALDFMAHVIETARELPLP